MSLCVTAGCVDQPEPLPAESPTGLALAQQWFVNLHEAERQGVVNMPAYLDPEVVLDHRGLGVKQPIVGRDAALVEIGQQWDPWKRIRASVAPVYVSRTGAIDRVRISSHFDPVDAVFVDSMGVDGITSEVFAASEVAWRRSLRADPRLPAMHRRATAYVSAWSSGSAGAVRELYAPETRLVDDLTGVQASGVEQVAALAGSPAQQTGAGPPSEVSLDRLADSGGPAVFAVGRPTTGDPPQLEAQVLLVTVDAGRGCPGHLAIELRLDERGRILQETRYHRTDSLTECAPQGSTLTGWWDDVELPPVIASLVTGELPIAGQDVQIVNGSEGLEALVRWSVGRFVARGLPEPRVRSITFVDKLADSCDRILGLISDREVTLCLRPADACANDACDLWALDARTVVLHELSHAWLDDHVTAQTRQALLDASGMETWASPQAPWGERGVELAASTLAWGLLEEPTSVHWRLGDWTCSQLTDFYLLLVDGDTPPFTSCAAGATPATP